MAKKRTTIQQETRKKDTFEHSFKTIVGHDLIKTIFNKMILSESLPQSIILSGPPNVGKESFAFALAKKLNCKGDGVDDCACRPCVKISRGTHFDMTFIEPDGPARFIRIDSIRDFQDRAYIFPVEGKKKVAIVDQADRMHAPSANSILKILEEPYPNLVIILVTSNLHFLLPTIRSRCSIFHFQPVGVNVIEDWLTNELHIEPQQAQVAAMLSEGRPGLAKMFAAGEGADKRKVLIDQIDMLIEKGAASIFSAASNLSKSSGDSLYDAQQALLVWFRDLLVSKIDDSAKSIVINKDAENEIDRQKAQFSSKALFYIIKMLLAEIEQSQRPLNSQLALETTLLHIGELRKKQSTF